MSTTRNLVFYMLYLILHKDRQFVIYMEKYGQAKVMEEMNKLISSLLLKKLVTDVSAESFKLFSYVEIDRKYQRHVLFIQSLICIYVNSSERIIDNPDVIGLDGISLLCNNRY